MSYFFFKAKKCEFWFNGWTMKTSAVQSISFFFGQKFGKLPFTDGSWFSFMRNVFHLCHRVPQKVLSAAIWAVFKKQILPRLLQLLARKIYVIAKKVSISLSTIKFRSVFRFIPNARMVLGRLIGVFYRLALFDWSHFVDFWFLAHIVAIVTKEICHEGGNKGKGNHVFVSHSAKQILGLLGGPFGTFCVP